MPFTHRSRSNRQLLVCPGPVNLASNVKVATATLEIGHREPEFSAIYRSVNQRLLRLYQVSHVDTYQAVVITGSGSAANEAVLSSVVGTRRILILTNGEFGDRLAAISRLHNPNTIVLEFGWGKPIDLDQLQRELQAQKPDIVAMVHHETSTGMLNPIERVGRMMYRAGAEFVVDTVSSAGAELIDLEACHITFCTGSANKAICSMPGVSYVVGERAAFEAIPADQPRTAYLNLAKFYEYATSYTQTPNTPAVQLFAALNTALGNILRMGLAKRHHAVLEQASFVRAVLRELGFTFVIPEDQMSVVLTTVIPPASVSADGIRAALREENIITYGGKGILSGRVLQIAHIGAITTRELRHLLHLLKRLATTTEVSTYSAVV